MAPCDSRPPPQAGARRQAAAGGADWSCGPSTDPARGFGADRQLCELGRGRDEARGRAGASAGDAVRDVTCDKTDEKKGAQGRQMRRKQHKGAVGGVGWLGEARRDGQTRRRHGQSDMDAVSPLELSVSARVTRPEPRHGKVGGAVSQTKRANQAPP